MLVGYNKPLRARAARVPGPEERVVPRAIVVEVDQQDSPVIHCVHVA